MTIFTSWAMKHHQLNGFFSSSRSTIFMLVPHPELEDKNHFAFKYKMICGKAFAVKLKHRSKHEIEREREYI